jgi:recombination protein RecA
VPIKFGIGVDAEADILEAALVLWLIDRKWAFYSIGDEKFQGKDKAATYLSENPDLRDSLESQIQEKIKEIRLGKPVIPADRLDTLKISQDDDDMDIDTIDDDDIIEDDD